MSSRTTKVTFITIAEGDNGSLGEITVGMSGFWYLPGADSTDAKTVAEKLLREAGFQWTDNMTEVWRSQNQGETD